MATKKNGNNATLVFNGVEYNITDASVATALTAILAPYAVATSTKSKSTTTKAKPKASDDTFDRAKYEATAKQLGCLGKHGVWKCCRPTVYGVMDGTITLAEGKKAVAKVKKDNGWA